MCNVYKWTIKDSDNVDIFMNISKELDYSSGKEVKKVTTFQIIGFIVLIILCVITYMMYRRKNNDI